MWSFRWDDRRLVSLYSAATVIVYTPCAYALPGSYGIVLESVCVSESCSA